VGPDELTEAALDFLVERHLATLTTFRADGSAHVVPVGFSWDPGTRLARVITSGASQKAANLRRDPRAVLCQLDGARWLTLEGTATVTGEPAAVAEAVRRYAARYRRPRENPARVALEIAVTRTLAGAALRP
jgi:PPOX class probable F420-dependent enzyme